MTVPACAQVAFPTLADYAAGDLPAQEAATVEDHVFTCPWCAARVAELEQLVRGIGDAIRAAGIGGFVTDAILNRLARDGVRIRMFALTPGAIVPCAVWDEDEMMALRLRAEFGSASEFTLTQHVGDTEVVRATTHVDAAGLGELVFATPASWIRQLPEVEVALVLTAREGDEQREVGRYTLVHGGSLRR